MYENRHSLVKEKNNCTLNPHILMTRLPTTCQCETLNFKMLTLQYTKIAVINAHNVFYSCEVYFFFFFKETASYTVVKTCIFIP